MNNTGQHLDRKLVDHEDKSMMTSPQQRRIRSYVLRAGRMSSTQKKAYQAYYESYVLNDLNIKNLPNVFAKQHPIICCIGFGMGEGLLVEAKQHPEKNFFGIEVHAPGVGALLEGIVKNGLDNIMIAHRDVVGVIDLLPIACIQNWQIFFPDPWPKQRHYKRRLIQDDFLNKIAQKTEEKGTLHIATDWEDYAAHCQEVLVQNRSFENTCADGAPNYPFLPIGECYKLRAETKYERRGKNLGHTIFDLFYKRLDISF